MNWILIMSLVVITFCFYTDGLPLKVYVKLGQNASFKCHHGLKPEMLRRVNMKAWQYNDMKDPIVLLNGSTLESKNDKFKDRLKMNISSWELSISSARVSDEGRFHCFLMVSGMTQDAPETYELEIVEVPKEVTIVCTGKDGINSPAKSCDDIKYDEVSSIRCSVSSRPETKVHWTKKPNCKTLKQKDVKINEDGISSYTNILSGVCNGTYQCNSTYVHGGHEAILSEMVILDSVVSDNVAQDQDKKILTAMIVVPILVIVLVIGIVLTVYVIKGRTKRSRELTGESTHSQPEVLKLRYTRETFHSKDKDVIKRNEFETTNETENRLNADESVEKDKGPFSRSRIKNILKGKGKSSKNDNKSQGEKPQEEPDAFLDLVNDNKPNLSTQVESARKEESYVCDSNTVEKDEFLDMEVESSKIEDDESASRLLTPGKKSNRESDKHFNKNHKTHDLSKESYGDENRSSPQSKLLQKHKTFN